VIFPERPENMGESAQVNGHTNLKVVETPLLIVGAGPAGASLACFLSHPPYSMTGLLISNQPTTSQTPRAHITNPACFECLRDIGLEETCLDQAVEGDCMVHTRWCHDMTGEEYARIYSWGNDPARKGEYEAATPCRHVDLPQTVFEPILIQRATAEGWDVRFKTTFVNFQRESSGMILSTVKDEITDTMYQVRSKYLFGADGGRSQIMRQLEIPLIKKPGQGLALNVLVDVDLSEFVDARRGNLHWVFQPETEYEDYAWSGLIRMVKPWHEWMFILFPKPNTEWKEPTTEQWMKVCKNVVGKNGADLPMKILNVSKWYINEIVAEYYSDPTNTIHCLGDAVHRHPPFNGLGSNTCVQDAYNLAWKIKYVHNNLASPSILGTFSPERQPVGLGVITRANQGIRDHTPVWDAMGVSLPTIKERMAAFDELKAATPAGRERRKRLNDAVEGTAHEFHAIGVEMNHRYLSDAVVLDDEKKADRDPPGWPEDKVLHHRASTYPGSRLPHAWLNKRVPVTKHTSTQDLAGHGRFTLFTGIGGEAWRDAAQKVAKELGVPIECVSIGWGQDWEDVYRDWEKKREIDEDGCILVRPDRYVCWRSTGLLEGNESTRLREVMGKVLGR
jgi:2-polyprenyl-6-methoxyphenol hydroxylase-like FAD-dependent oxidoreductase